MEESRLRKHNSAVMMKVVGRGENEVISQVLVVDGSRPGSSRQPSQALRPAGPTIDDQPTPTLVANIIITMVQEGNEEAKKEGEKTHPGQV